MLSSIDTSLPPPTTGKLDAASAHYTEDPDIVEIGVDEVGRGPLFGRVYVAAVILPKHSDTYQYSLMKDSKRFSSAKKITEAYDYIVSNCIDHAVNYETESTIDNINILQATQRAMHKCVQDLITRNNLVTKNTLILIDGNYFKPHSIYNKDTGIFECYNHICIKGGDTMFCSIAAASIVAKVTRDKYIVDLCSENPLLDERYALSSNKGYGAKVHRDGILQHGITQWHRKTFGICKNYAGV